MMLTLGKFSAVTGLSRLKVQQACDTGKINGVKMSGGWRISEEELHRFQAEGYITEEPYILPLSPD